ncbi:MAG: 16S rRNA (cytidine(1402)-2'-O)-methyltransferase [Synergistaceae bacterium]|nr:16S rRNA (cytidine(1402)-2'-O)-methyltransferase [Synergistaceae bacterium]
MPLVIVPTPIGNLGDITARGLDALKNADVIACEDTRRTLKLLNHFGIKKPLVSYHRHNERSRSGNLLERLERGETVALVSDAGTPGISDPGHVIIEAAIERGVEIDALPGANAVLPALLMSGLPARQFFFAGFVNGSESDMKAALESLRDIRATLVFYVAPHDLEKFLSSADRAFGSRRGAVAREISKVHQETIRGSLLEILETVQSRELKGEIVVIVEGAATERDEVPPENWERLACAMKKTGIRDKEIANVLFESYGIPRNRVKNFLTREASIGERDK